jgi:hypothetical protein
MPPHFACHPLRFGLYVQHMAIKFTPQELKWIERIRKQQLRWPKLRWFNLSAGIFIVLCFSFIFIMLFNMPGFPGREDNPEDLTASLILEVNWSILFALYWPQCLIGFIFGTWIIVWTKLNWPGNANRLLLLRLLDANQNQGDEESRANPDT